MATMPGERRLLSDRRAPAERASDLLRRIEEKRQEIERRQAVRRLADRETRRHAGESMAPQHRDSKAPRSETPKR